MSQHHSPDLRRITGTARAGFGAVVLAAAVSGLALLIAPASTGQYFSWGLGPPPLAALVGGLYLASAVTFGVALRLPWRGVRSLLAASVTLTTPTLVFTLVHIDIFDMGRWQAWAWMALFAAAPPFWAGLLWSGRGGSSPTRTSGAVSPAMVAIAAMAAIWAIVMWVDPETAWRPVPFEVAGLGGRFVGAWLGFLAVMAAWSGLRPDERLLPSVALATYPAGALVAGLRSIAGFSSLAAGFAYLGTLGVLTVVFAAGTIRVSRPAHSDKMAG